MNTTSDAARSVNTDAARPVIILHSYNEPVDWRTARRLQSLFADSLLETRNDPNRTAAGHLLLLEHRPTITIGRAGGRDHLHATIESLQSDGLDVIDCDRGGDITAHGPGQLTVYAVFDLTVFGKDVGAHIRRLEQIALDAMAEYSIQGIRLSGKSGAWVSDNRGTRKLCAVGIGVRHWVAYHGLGFNVDQSPLLDRLFGAMTPCGIEGGAVTSLAKETGRAVPMADIKAAVARAAGIIFNAEIQDVASGNRRGGNGFPEWMAARRPPPRNDIVNAALEQCRISTVCREARCPNIGDCHRQGTAAFMILGDICTRNCAFCAVSHGTPTPLDETEPKRLATAAAKLGLRHIVVTSVTRDNLPDEGASHFAGCIIELRRELPDATIEVLTPDFHARRELIGIVIDAGPDVFNHNLETVERLSAVIRPQADYRRSLTTLKIASELGKQKGIAIKSGLMVGLGETGDEMRRAMADIREAGASMLTVGQYLQPSKRTNVPVAEYIHPDVFDDYRRFADALGFDAVASNVYARSSHLAGELYERLAIASSKCRVP